MCDEAAIETEPCLRLSRSVRGFAGRVMKLYNVMKFLSVKPMKMGSLIARSFL